MLVVRCAVHYKLSNLLKIHYVYPIQQHTACQSVVSVISDMWGCYRWGCDKWECDMWGCHLGFVWANTGIYVDVYVDREQVHHSWLEQQVWGVTVTLPPWLTLLPSFAMSCLLFLSLLFLRFFLLCFFYRGTWQEIVRHMCMVNISNLSSKTSIFHLFSSYQYRSPR